MNGRFSRIFIVLSALLAVMLVGLGAVFYERWAVQAGASAAAIGGPFTLIDQNGRRVTERDLIGKPFLVFFGYTHCPDVCPTTLFDLSEVMRAMGKDADRTNVLFVTVDPEHDTAAILKDYLSSFDSHVIGLTGDREAIDAMIKTYRVYAKKMPAAKDNEYIMDHTKVVYLMDKYGRFVAPFKLDRTPDASAAELRRYF